MNTVDTSVAGSGTHPVDQSRGHRPSNQFYSPSEFAEVAVLVVTYNNEKDVPLLIEGLRQEAADQSIKVVIADNSPTYSTLEVAGRERDVVAFATGGNFGYACAINAAKRRAGMARTYLVLNPDLRIEPGAIQALRKRLDESHAGVVVPLLADEDGSTYPSLRREPSLSRATGDALMGSRLSRRPGWLSEIDYHENSYRQAHQVDWATGAALLISCEAADAVGDWDESYFLYSEETDYMRRVRSLGFEIWFEPQAKMVHSRGGSGSSPGLEALMGVNRIKYVRKFHRAAYANTFHAIVVLSALLRLPLPGRAIVFGLVARESRWKQLPQAVAYPSGQLKLGDIPRGSIIIPAHNEAAVLGRTLEALKLPLAAGRVEVIVACNGCTDGTRDVALLFPGVQVLEIPEASKVAALNAADQAATLWPRLYLDADIELPAAALAASFEALSKNPELLCARPAFTYDTDGASWLVRAYYRARNRLPQASASIWGAGVYGLNREGHRRLGKFPEVTGDDCLIDRLFHPYEKKTLASYPVKVRTPRSSKALLATLNRIYRGNAELQHVPGSHPGRTVTELLLSVSGPLSALDAFVYGMFALLGRVRRRRIPGWERDESSRTSKNGSNSTTLSL